MTNLFVLTWNPRNWEWPAAELSSAITQTSAGVAVADRWSVGARRSGIVPGDRAVLLRQHSERGLVASGTFTTEIFLDDHWDDTPRLAAYADLEWDAVVDAADRLPIEILNAQAPWSAWDRMQGSGVLVPTSIADVVDSLWTDHVHSTPVHSPEEPRPADGYVEGAVVQVIANRYERDRRARVACITHWGTDCAACGMNFSDTYGELGEGFIHVHHLRELSQIGEEYEVDPVKDLRPICPNCHAMVHRSNPCMTIAQLRKRIQTMRKH